MDKRPQLSVQNKTDLMPNNAPCKRWDTPYDVDTFLTTLYVIVDDFCKTSLPLERHPGPQATLSRSEVVTLAIFGQCGVAADLRRPGALSPETP
jgi:hypothetical protein